MIDVQSELDTREIPLKKVGVRGLMYPVQVLDKAKKMQATTANADLFVNLPHNLKGTHMSRFIEIFHKYTTNFSMQRFLAMLTELCVRLKAEHSFAVVSFPFFIEKKAPVSGQIGMICYTCTYEGSVSMGNGESQRSDFYVSVEVPVTTLCPCSKEISEYGAHNQRGLVRVKVQSIDFFWIEDIITLIEKCASSQVYSILKRKDEKYVTEQAYRNPRFVEDLVREVYVALRSFPIQKPFQYFCIEVENFESIHTHNAYACTEYRE